MALLIQAFLQIGYSVRLQKVNLAAYGVPQTRKRVFIIGNRLGVDFQFPQETHSFDSGKSKKLSDKPFAPTLADALAGLGATVSMRNERVPYTSKYPLGNFDATMRAGNTHDSVTEHADLTDADNELRYALLEPGQTMKDLPESYWHQSFKKRAFRRVMDGTPTEKRGGAPSGIKRLQNHLQSLTITGAASREFIHPFEHRPLTVRECMRLQTFPDRFEVIGNAGSVAQQVGNAMPPLAAAVFAKHLQYLDGLFGAGLAIPQRVRHARLLGFVLTDSTGMSQALQQTQGLLSSMLQEELAFA